MNDRSVIAIKDDPSHQVKDSSVKPLWQLGLLALLASLVCFPPESLAGQERIKPTVPTALKATPIDCNRIDISWNFSTDSGGSGLQGYYLYRGKRLLGEIYAPNTSYSDTGLTASTSYSYYILAMDNAGNKSAKAGPANATTPACSSSICTYSVLPGSSSIGSGASSGTVNVTCGLTCAWTPSSSDPSWLTCSPPTGTGGGALTWWATANTATSPRSATLNIAGQTFTVSQAASIPTCTYAVSPSSANPGSAATSGTLTVTADAGCAWTASSSAPTWLTCSPTSGTGTGSLTWSVGANNSTSPRTATLNIAGQTFTVTQQGTPCSYAISVTSVQVPAAGATIIDDVTCDNTCPWTASSSVNWITFISGASATGPATVYCNVATNTTTAARTGTVTIAGQSLTVTQSAATVSCSYTIAPLSANAGAGAVSGTITVTAAAGCNWTASSSDPTWLTCSPANGSGSGSVTWSVSANTSTSSRTATLSVAGQAFSVTQAGASCTYAISPTGATPGASAGNGVITVTALAGCAWTASSSDSTWLTCSPASGGGSGSVTWSAAANASTSPRSAKLTVGGQTFTVNQAAASCTYTLSPASANPGAAAASGTVSVTALAGCNWTTTSSDSTWLTCSPATGSGSSSVTWSVTANSSTSPRSATLSVAGQSFTVNQAAASCSYTLSAASANPGAAAANGTVSVTALAGCNWTTASSDSTWLTCSPATGAGSSSVTWSATANGTCSPRSATLTIAGQRFSVNQAAGSGSFSISPGSANIAASGGNGLVNVTATAGCSWSVSGGASWVTVSGSGTGNGSAVYSATANTSTSTRSTSVTIAGQPFLVTQAGATITDNPPTVGLTAPGSSANISGTYTFTANATDDLGVSKVEFWCDGSILLGTATGSGPNYSVSYDTAGTANGTHSFTAKAFDTGGHSTTSSAISANINNTTTGTPGKLQWAKTMISTLGAGAYAVDVAADQSGNVVVVGYFRTSIDLGNGAIAAAGTMDAFIAKYNAQGAILWIKHFAGSAGNGVLVKSVGIDSQGNIVVTGSFSGGLDLGSGALTSAGGYDIFVAKYSSAGAHVWSKRFGGTYSDTGITSAIDGSDNVVVGAAFGSMNANFGGITLSSLGADDVAIFKLRAADGATLWAVQHGGADEDTPCGVAIDRAGDVVVTGNFWTSIDLGGGSKAAVGGQDGFVAKYSGVDGHYLWGKTVGSSGPDNCGGITTDPNTGNVIITGGSGGADFGGGAATPGIFVAAYGPSGNYLWTLNTLTTGQSGDYGVGICMDAAGNLGLTGKAQGFLLFAGQPLALVGNGTGNNFTAGFTVSGNSAPVYRWAQRSAVGTDWGTAITFDSLGHVLVTGGFNPTTDVGGVTLSGPSGTDGGFVAQYTQ